MCLSRWPTRCAHYAHPFHGDPLHAPPPSPLLESIVTSVHGAYTPESTVTADTREGMVKALTHESTDTAPESTVEAPSVKAPRLVLKALSRRPFSPRAHCHGVCEGKVLASRRCVRLTGALPMSKRCFRVGGSCEWRLSVKGEKRLLVKR